MDLSFYKLNCFNGLGFIYPKNKSFDNIIDNVVGESNILEIIENNYNNVVVSLIQNRNQVDILNSSLVTKQDEIHKLLSERDSLVERNVVLSESYESLSSKKDSWEKYNNSLLDKISVLNKENENLVSERDSLVERNVVLSEENMGLVSERDSLIDRISNLNNKRDYLVEKNLNLVSEKNLLMQRFNALKNSKNKLVKDMSSLIDENLKLRNKNRSLLESHSWKLTAPFRKVIFILKNK